MENGVLNLSLKYYLTWIEHGCFPLFLGFNGSGPVRFLAQYSVQTLIRSRSRSTSVTVRFGFNFGFNFSTVKNFQISKTSFKCQKIFNQEV